jgi:hypothetical protein
MSEARSAVVYSALPPHMKQYIQHLVENLGGPYSESYVVFKLLEYAIAQHKKGEVEI